MDRIVALLESLEEQRQLQRSEPVDDAQRAADAMVALKRGANSFADIARALGISRSTAQRSLGIRRAYETVFPDRKHGKDETEDFRWQD